jgi:hypothetical protein
MVSPTVAAPDGEIDLPVVQLKKDVPNSADQIPPNNAPFLVSGRGDLLDGKRLPRVELHP